MPLLSIHQLKLSNFGDSFYSVPSWESISQYPFQITPPLSIYSWAEGSCHIKCPCSIQCTYTMSIIGFPSSLPFLCQIPILLSAFHAPPPLFIQVKLDTAPYEPPFTDADKKELQPNFALSSLPPRGHSFSDSNVRYGLLSTVLLTHSFHIKFLAAKQTMAVCAAWFWSFISLCLPKIW